MTKTTPTHIRKSKGDRIFQIINIFLLSIGVLIILYPLWFVVIASFSNSGAVLAGKVTFVPIGFHLTGYEKVFQNSQIMQGYRNTIVYTLLGTLINIVATIAAAFPLSRRDFVGRKGIMLFISFTMFFSGGLIPTYLVYRDMQILNTPWVMLLPGAISVYNMIICRSFFESIPYELQEAAYIDGSGNIGILLRIILPLSKPILAVLVIFYGVAHWNSYFNALMFMPNSQNLHPLQLVLRNILITTSITADSGVADSSVSDKLLYAETLKYAVIVVSTLPIMMVYPFLQKFFTQGVMLGAVKG